jgi:CheY-like chemotaxis protein
MKQIYLVDDDDDDRLLARQALESVAEEIEIVELTNGYQLLAVLEAAPSVEPAMVLMDMNMPLVNGIEALAALKSRDDWRHIPVVMFSTNENPKFVEKAYQLGVNAYIVKPASFEGYTRMAQAVTLCFLNHYMPRGGDFYTDNDIAKNIVIIEDNPDHAVLMKFLLKKNAPKLNVVFQTSQESAVSYFKSLGEKASAAIDLIILDLYLPDREQGLDLLVWLRSTFMERGIPAVPIIVLSASSHQRDIKASYGLQANAYLTKTAEPAESFSYLTDLCSYWSDTISLPVNR